LEEGRGGAFTVSGLSVAALCGELEDRLGERPQASDTPLARHPTARCGRSGERAACPGVSECRSGPGGLELAHQLLKLTASSIFAGQDERQGRSESGLGGRGERTRVCVPMRVSLSPRSGCSDPSRHEGSLHSHNGKPRIQLGVHRPASSSDRWVRSRVPRETLSAFPTYTTCHSWART